jgi:CHAT domain-containing protein
MVMPSVLAKVPEVTTNTQRQQDIFELIKQGKSFYEQGNYADAKKVLEKAAMDFEKQGDKVNQAMALSNLSLIYQQLGEWDEADQAINKSLAILSKHKTRKELRIYAQSLDIKGKLQHDRGRSPDALENWQQATKIYAQISDRDGVTQGRINQAQAMQDLGLYPEACNMLISALDIDLENIGKDLKFNISIPNCWSLAKLDNTEIDKFTDNFILRVNQKPDSQLKFDGLHSLGDIFQLVVGNLTKYDRILQEAEKVAEKLNSPQDKADAYLSLGNITKAIAESKGGIFESDSDDDIKKAISNYQKSAISVTSGTSRILAELNQLTLLPQEEKWSEFQKLWCSLKADLNSLPLSRQGIYAQINFTNSWIGLKNKTNFNHCPDIQLPIWKEIDQVLMRVIQQAGILKDKLGEAYAIGNRGALYQFLYEKDKDLKNLHQAVVYTNQAIEITQSIQASEATYQLFWQLGKLYKAQGNINDAISAYTAAFHILQKLGSDLVASNQKNQFYFRTIVEPIYRQLVELDLELAQKTKDNQDLIEQARQVIESLQLNELNNFFRSVCLHAKAEQIDTIDQNAAVIYPIILEDRLQIILSLPDPNPKSKPKRILSFKTPQENDKPIDKKAIEEEANNFSRVLSQPQDTCELDKLSQNQDTCELDKLSQKLYQWLIKPLEQQLKECKIEKCKINTLVFVLDGKLKNIPMAALKNDNGKYLIQEYAIAVTPGLQLLESKGLQSLESKSRKPLKVFTAGLTEGGKDKKLDLSPAVKPGFKEIHAMGIPGETLLDEKFTKRSLENRIIASHPPIVYLATHGYFGYSVEDTYIYTFDEKININQLNELLRNSTDDENKPIELLVLSGCETIRGDEQTALGLAGIAVRAGARSTIGTLWQVPDDSSSKLMVKFFNNIKNKTNKAEALRRAQVDILYKDKKPPYDWAGFVLLGNWL